MICDILKLFSQNICKNSLIVNTILETQILFDIIFIQESSWSIIWSITSSVKIKEYGLGFFFIFFLILFSSYFSFFYF